MSQSLLALRAVTVQLRRIPGALLLLESVRRGFGHQPRPPVVVADFDGNQLEVRLDEHMGSHIFWYGSYSKEVLVVVDQILRPGMTVLDIGANIGEVSVFAARRVGAGGRVYAFEPLPSIARILRGNIDRNGRGDVITLVPSGVSDTPGQAQLYSGGAPFSDGTQHAGLGTLYPQEGRAAPAGVIDLTTVDAFVASVGNASPDLIKIDVEGAELPALRGARATIARCHPWFILEVQEETSRAAGYTAADILTFLGEFGYQFGRIGRRGVVTPLTVATLTDFQNVVAIPPGRSLPAR